jgi:Fe-S cluster assembly ATP-binding protein
MDFLTVKNVSLKLNGNLILDNISIDFWRGHIHAIVGPNGAGKSTLAYTIMGLEEYRDFDGDIIFKNESIKNWSIDERARKGITLTWQEPARYEGLSVRDFILAAADEKTTDAAEDALTKVGLSPAEYLSRAVDTSLSGGERKKIELASTIAMNPEVILFDEPDSGIDVASLRKIFDVLRLLKEMGTTVIMITHSPDVLRHAEHAFLTCCGRLVDKGSVARISTYFEEECIPCDHKNRPDLKEAAK